MTLAEEQEEEYLVIVDRLLLSNKILSLMYHIKKWRIKKKEIYQIHSARKSSFQKIKVLENQIQTQKINKDMILKRNVENEDNEIDNSENYKSEK